MKDGINLHKVKKAHFIGIGGIGISAIARMMLHEGKEVSGSDSSESTVTEELNKLGARIFIGQKKEQVSSDTDLVVYTIAVPPSNPEMREAKKLHIPLLSYPEMLQIVSEKKFTIAVSGTHGKTTTTAMIAKVMKDAGLDPTVIVGSLLKDEKSNFISGKSEYFVVEACEYRRSFLNLSPKILVITNIDADHLDYYKDMADIEKAFSELVAKVPKSGYIICNTKDSHVRSAVKDAIAKVIDYTAFQNNKIKLQTPGLHNRENAAAVLAVSHVLEINNKKAEKFLESFSGTWRRFDYKGITKTGARVYDDYAHHPREIKATLSGARELFPKNNIFVVFQPHLYSRTKDHLADFGRSFAHATETIIAPIYAAREKHDKSISAEMVAEEIVKNGGKASSKDFEEIERYLNEHTKKDDVIIVMGAGDITNLAGILVNSKS